LKAKPNGTGWVRLLNATRCSIAGLTFAFQKEAAFRQELALTCILIPTAFFVAQNSIELVMLIAPLLLMLCVECINSAIEAAIDRVSLEIHPLSKQAKDLGSAAVFFAFLLVLLPWLSIVGLRLV
jgi:diacylglycerol kinase (ATP)